MQCMVLQSFHQPLVLTERATPVPGPDEAIVRVGACGLCRTDLKIWHGTHPALRQLPLVPGHEVAGEVVEVGRAVAPGLLGKHAVVYCYLTCGECEYCRSGSEILCRQVRGQIGFNLDGGFAEYVRVPAKNLFVIAPEIPLEEAAIVTDAIATPYRALVRKARLRGGERVVVIGAGGLGVHALQIARVLGARTAAVDVNEAALQLAAESGAELTLNSSQDDPAGAIADWSGGGVEVVMDFVARPATQQLGLRLLKPGGKFLSIAYAADNLLEVNSQQLVSRELEICGSRSCGRKDLEETIEWMVGRKIKAVITARYRLAEANAALARLEKGDLAGRMVLIP